MRLSNTNLIYGGLAVLGGLLLYNRFRSSGSKARVGDEVLVGPESLPVPVPGTANAQFVVIKVTAETSDTLTGQVIAAQGTPQLPFGPSVTVRRSAVKTTVREGKVV